MNTTPESSVNNVVVDLNVGGVFYSTTVATLTSQADCVLAKLFNAGDSKRVMHNGKIFIDRDGILFRYVLDYLRNNQLLLPASFQEHERLRQEAEYYELPDLIKCISKVIGLQAPGGGGGGGTLRTAVSINGIASTLGPPRAVGLHEAGCITVGYRGTFAFGRDGAGASDVKFRKLLRILVAGRVSICKEVFQDTLNESRDPDRGDNDRYTARFFLKHVFLEQAFDMLYEARFRMVGSTGSGTNSSPGGDAKGPGQDSEENKWLHYNEYVFTR